MLAKATPTCKVIRTSPSEDSVEILVGFATGEILWVDLAQGRYLRFNKSVRNVISGNALKLTMCRDNLVT